MKTSVVKNQPKIGDSFKKGYTSFIKSCFIFLMNKVIIYFLMIYLTHYIIYTVASKPTKKARLDSSESDISVSTSYIMQLHKYFINYNFTYIKILFYIF